MTDHELTEEHLDRLPSADIDSKDKWTFDDIAGMLGDKFTATTKEETED